MSREPYIRGYEIRQRITQEPGWATTHASKSRMT